MSLFLELLSKVGLVQAICPSCHSTNSIKPLQGK